MYCRLFGIFDLKVMEKKSTSEKKVFEQKHLPVFRISYVVGTYILGMHILL